MLTRSLLVGAAICMAMTAGCASVTGGSDASGSSTVSATDWADVAPRAASIPGMSFVPETSVRNGDAIEPGDTMLDGSYRAAMTGRSVSSVQWVVGEIDGINREMLTLRFDDTGKAKLEKLTRMNVEKHVLVILDGRVVDKVAVFAPIANGELTLDSGEISLARSLIDSATVPAD